MISIPTILEGLRFMLTNTLFVVIVLLFYPRSAVRTGTDLQAAVRTGADLQAAVRTGTDLQAAVRTGTDLQAAVRMVDEGQEAIMEKLVARKGRVFVLAPDRCGGSRSWFTQEISNWRQRHGLLLRAWPLDDE